MTLSVEELARQNAYLKLRNAQLESDVVALGAEAARQRQIIGVHPSSPTGGAGS